MKQCPSFSMDLTSPILSPSEFSRGQGSHFIFIDTGAHFSDLRNGNPPLPIFGGPSLLLWFLFVPTSQNRVPLQFPHREGCSCFYFHFWYSSKYLNKIYQHIMAFKTIWLRQKFHILFSFSFFLSPSTIFDITHYILRFLVVQYSILYSKFQEKKVY